ncbi:lipopolysaccharide heptosyltransferase I [Propionivibrio sp.]|uniref:lipopolysaccharide heptosyltransferase I n=1 Tax=Propionivibrio sp. TaxID=2212460 RepID=UPI0025ECD8A5|nr:lipopolysaccharide heptosyltransferase I [Propionivibrio sp.]MBK7354927.1 lipopolysaccharide heptosyltransferase I [Propionivibrio sp.]MBK8402296.1 lipopolysaccharide heptosyltransferase I [Propionivibrio sp.]MBK8743454.1 lipopolysaccharide heptosyltransferase I [Propionivibrio sp.]MBK8892757.1 lipopolysaccharide heptosyltransferase I [Propionivibrio sp.]MBL0206589.1 lipopolysaccharide heptosyltransferase I [Propionivibrio sp.]
MRILLVKTSSLGDVIHNLPVVSDLRRCLPEAQIDWCVEEAFAEIPRLHPEVGEIIPVALRRWRKSLIQWSTWSDFGEFKKELSGTYYDAILDTQGLVKSALLARLARGRRYGYAAEVAREPLAARFYDETFVIPPNAHAVERNRWLAAAAFNLPVDLPLNYGIDVPKVNLSWFIGQRYAVLLTATSRDDKLWNEPDWVLVARNLFKRGLIPIFPSGNALERERALRIVAAVPGALVAPPLSLGELACLISKATLVIGVDTGLVHLATALKIPTIALYIASDPALTGVYGTGFFRNLGTPGRAPRVNEVLSAADQGIHGFH